MNEFSEMVCIYICLLIGYLFGCFVGYQARKSEGK